MPSEPAVPPLFTASIVHGLQDIWEDISTAARERRRGICGYDASKNRSVLPPFWVMSIRTWAAQRGHQPTYALPSTLMYART
jgi:hypothetical protein